jgi:hypothetical protein
VFAVGLDAAFQLFSGDEYKPEQTAIAGVSSLASYGVGVLITRSLMKSAFTHQLASRLNCTTRLFSSAVSGFGAGTAFSVVYSTLMYFCGEMDGTTALRTAVAGAAGAGGGALATVGIMTLATTYGTASTGTAIATLSGAAAKSAALAWLGGGAASAGGGGVALGSVVLTGGAAIAAIAVSAVVMYGFSLWDAQQTANDIMILQAFLDDKESNKETYWHNQDALRLRPAM